MLRVTCYVLRVTYHATRNTQHALHFELRTYDCICCRSTQSHRQDRARGQGREPVSHRHAPLCPPPAGADLAGCDHHHVCAGVAGAADFTLPARRDRHCGFIASGRAGYPEQHGAVSHCGRRPPGTRPLYARPLWRARVADDRLRCRDHFRDYRCVVGRICRLSRRLLRRRHLAFGGVPALDPDAADLADYLVDL